MAIKKVCPSEKDGVSPGILFWVVVLDQREAFVLPAPSQSGRVHASRAIHIHPDVSNDQQSFEREKIAKIIPVEAKRDERESDLWNLDGRKIEIVLRD